MKYGFTRVGDYRDCYGIIDLNGNFVIPCDYERNKIGIVSLKDYLFDFQKDKVDDRWSILYFKDKFMLAKSSR